MIRPGLAAALFVCLATAAPSAAGELRAAKDPIAGSYIVVFKSDAVAVPARHARSGRWSRMPPATSLARTAETSTTSTSTRSRASPPS